VGFCIEGPHHECWSLPEGGAMNDVVHKDLGPGDQLVLWHDEGGGAGRVRAENCDGPTNLARFVQGGTSGSFDVTKE
jgi:hypothetical protein